MNGENGSAMKREHRKLLELRKAAPLFLERGLVGKIKP
jgi:hypothetical protein